MASRRRRATPYYSGGGTDVSATTASLTLTALTASVRAEIETRVSVTTASLVLTPLAVTVRAEIETRVSVSLGTLTLSPQDPTVSADVVVSATTASLTLTPLATTVTDEIETRVTTTLAALTLTPLAVTVTAETETRVGVTVGSLTLTPLIAGVVTGIKAHATAGVLTLTPFPATVRAETETRVAATAGVLTLTPFAVAVFAEIETSVGVTLAALTLTPLAAVIQTDTTANATAGLLTLTPLNVSVSVGTSIGASSAVLTLTPLAASIQTDTSVTVSTGSLVLTPFDVTVQAALTVNATAGALTLTPYAASINVATTYWVDGATGNDANDGSIGSPWLTPDEVLNRTFSPGDTINVKDGTYNVGPQGNYELPAVRILQDGTAALPITIRSENLYGAKLVANNTGSATPAIGSRSDYIVIERFEIDANGNQQGARVMGTVGTDLVGGEFRYNKVHNVYSGASDNTDGFRLENANNYKIHHNEIYNVHNFSQSTNAACIKLYYLTDIEIHNNTIYDGVSGIKAKEECVNITVRNNLIYGVSNSTVGILINEQSPSPGSSNWQIYENVIRDYSVCVQSTPPSSVTVNTLKIWNNTFHNYSNSGIYLASDTASSFTVTDIHVWNNIFIPGAGRSGFEFATVYDETPDITYFDYNLVYGDYDWVLGRYGTGPLSYTSWAAWQAAGYDTNGVDADPLFVDEAADNFHLTPSSPAKGTGRYSDDIGAYPAETGNTSFLTVLDTFTITPHDVSLIAETTVNATVAALTLTPYTSVITESTDTVVSATLASLVYTAQAATITLENEVVVEATAGTLTFTPYAVGVNQENEARVTVTLGVLTLTPLATTITTGAHISVTLDTLTLTALDAAITGISSGGGAVTVQILWQAEKDTVAWPADEDTIAYPAEADTVVW